MNIRELMEQEQPKIIEGTSCVNCDFTKHQKTEKVTEDDLNKFGGIDPTSKQDIAGAKKADLITMPGAKFPTIKLWCKQPAVDQWVTERMCCNFWNAPGIHEEYK